MAIRLRDKANVVAPDVDYPHGRIRNKNGGTPGTPVDTAVYGDFHQFFAELMDKAGIAHNGLPDNATNGYQFIQALEKLTGFGAYENAGSPTPVTSDTGTVALFNANSYKSRRKIVGKTFIWDFSGQFVVTGTPSTITIPIPLPSGVVIESLFINCYRVFKGDDSGNPINVTVDGNNALVRRATGSFPSGARNFWFRIEVEIQ